MRRLAGRYPGYGWETNVGYATALHRAALRHLGPCRHHRRSFVNGLVELLPLDDDRLIAMERSFSVGAPGTGNTIKLFGVSLLGTTARKRLL